MKNLGLLFGSLTVAYFLFNKKKQETTTQTAEAGRLNNQLADASLNCRMYKDASGSYHYNEIGTPIPSGSTCVAVYRN